MITTTVSRFADRVGWKRRRWNEPTRSTSADSGGLREIDTRVPLFARQEPRHLAGLGRSPANPVTLPRSVGCPGRSGRPEGQTVSQSLRRLRLEPEPHHQSRRIASPVPPWLRAHYWAGKTITSNSLYHIRRKEGGRFADLFTSSVVTFSRQPFHVFYSIGARALADVKR